MAKPKPRPRKTSGTPIDARQAALQQQEEKLRQDMQRLKSFVEKAPEMKKAAEERRREELISRASAGSHRIDTPRLLDRRFEVVVSSAEPRPRGRSLKKEQRQQRITFFSLLIALLLLAFWLFSIWR
jgi:hypothetical protein